MLKETSVTQVCAAIHQMYPNLPYCTEDQACLTDFLLAVQIVITVIFWQSYARASQNRALENAMVILVIFQLLLLWVKVGYFARC